MSRGPLAFFQSCYLIVTSLYPNMAKRNRHLKNFLIFRSRSYVRTILNSTKSTKIVSTKMETISLHILKEKPYYSLRTQKHLSRAFGTKILLALSKYVKDEISGRFLFMIFLILLRKAKIISHVVLSNPLDQGDNRKLLRNDFQDFCYEYE